MKIAARIAGLTVLLLLSFLVVDVTGALYPQAGVQDKEQYYRFDANKETLCTGAVATDCVKAVRFFHFDATGQRVQVIDIGIAQLANLGNGLLEATAPVPTISGRYNSGFPLYATHVAVDAAGKEVEAVPLGTSFAKKPAPGVEFKTR